MRKNKLNLRKEKEYRGDLVYGRTFLGVNTVNEVKHGKNRVEEDITSEEV